MINFNLHALPLIPYSFCKNETNFELNLPIILKLQTRFIKEKARGTISTSKSSNKMKACISLLILDFNFKDFRALQEPSFYSLSNYMKL